MGARGGAAGVGAAAGAPWRVELKQFDVRDASISAEDRSVQPPAKVVLAPLSLGIGGASLDLGKPVDVKLDTRINGGGSLAISGEVTPQPAAMSLNLKLADIDLTPAQPYIAQRTSMTLRSGKLGGAGQMLFSRTPSAGTEGQTEGGHPAGPKRGAAGTNDASKGGAAKETGAKETGAKGAGAKGAGAKGAGAKGAGANVAGAKGAGAKVAGAKLIRAKVAGAKVAAALRFVGNIDVEDLYIVDDLRHNDLIRWERLDIQALNFQQDPNRLEIGEVLVRKPYARVIVESDATLNVSNALKQPGGDRGDDASANAAAPKPVKANSAAAGPAKSPQAVRGKGPVGTDSKTPTQSASAAMPMAIKKVLIKQGLANFTDLSVTPNFSAAIQHLEGSVLGLSSKPGSRAVVDLHGAVDAFSPVSITGQVNLLGTPLYADLALDFRNMELSIFNPYSGKFAGYDISKGKLTTELHYKIDGRKLDAQHHIVIDQLEFGAKTDSKEAVSLPIKLAVALLKDRNGVIDLNVPVTGSLDDPQFRLAPIIWKVFVNILEKAVTAPFALLGSLFGGGPDLQFIDFRPGTSSLDGAQDDKVKSIVKALQGRPQLKIEVPIAVVPALDRPALIDAELAAELREAMTPANSRGKPAPAAGAPSFDQLDPSAKLDVLTRVYRHDLDAEPKYPAAVTSGKQKPEQIAAKIDFMTNALHEHMTVGEEQLKTLGQQRAQALQQALLTDSQIAPERVFLVANDKASAAGGAVRLELSLR